MISSALGDEAAADMILDSVAIFQKANAPVCRDVVSLRARIPARAENPADTIRPFGTNLQANVVHR
jgi:hypothetical protein